MKFPIKDFFSKCDQIHRPVTKFTFTEEILNPLSANFTKWSNALKQFVGNLPTNYLSVFDHFVRLALKGLMENFIFCVV